MFQIHAGQFTQVQRDLLNKELGFIDGQNYISCNLENMNEKINYITNPDNRKKIDIIRKNGYEFVRKYHLRNDRFDKLDSIIVLK